jgi:hypothetical protein
MNRISKKITTRFFSIVAVDNFYDDFAAIYNANYANEKTVRIFNVRGKKYLVKIHDELRYDGTECFFLSVVRERNTWQARALGNGKISGIPLNQGIIGDPYYYLIVPRDKIILGFTTGPGGSLKSVANTTLQQFVKDRDMEISVEHISKGKEYSRLTELVSYSSLHFKVNTASLGDVTVDTPGILRELSAAPFMAINSKIAITLTEIEEDGFSRSDLLEIVDYLAENDGCSALTVQGINDEGQKVFLNFSKTHAVYQTVIETRNKFVDEKLAEDILSRALESFDHSMLAN